MKRVRVSVAVVDGHRRPVRGDVRRIQETERRDSGKRPLRALTATVMMTAALGYLLQQVARPCGVSPSSAGDTLVGHAGSTSRPRYAECRSATHTHHGSPHHHPEVDAHAKLWSREV